LSRILMKVWFVDPDVGVDVADDAADEVVFE
jgi:hypothetical protein